jgi:polysaccharide deacetylase family protein (PEP-CTERM system associated)
LIREISKSGHEIACHGDKHFQIDKLTPEKFRLDLQANINILKDLSGQKIKGFRAPTFSLTEATSWAYEILSDLNIRYSSSVLPARNPLYGWPEFGTAHKLIAEDLWELPITINPLPGLSVPIAGGVYFRVLPFFLTKWAVKRKLKENKSVGTYFHPYDIDLDQERFMHPDLDGKKHLNMLMYIGRGKVLKRLAWLNSRFRLEPYGRYVGRLGESS